MGATAPGTDGLGSLRCSRRQPASWRYGAAPEIFDGGFDALHLFSLPESTALPSWARRVLIIALPRPAHRSVLRVDGQRRLALLPPTYLNYSALFEEVRAELTQAAGGKCRFAALRAPLKGVATRLGLVRYGRNNLVYLPGCGSYLQLLGYAIRCALAAAARLAARRAADAAGVRR